MDREHLEKIAAGLYLEDNFWGELSAQDANTRLHYMNKAERLIRLLEKIGLSIVGGKNKQDDDRGQPTGGASHP